MADGDPAPGGVKPRLRRVNPQERFSLFRQRLQRTGDGIMMELPESYALSKQISSKLAGKVISRVEILKTPHRFTFFKSDTARYPELLEGRTVTGSVFKGGMLEIDTDGSMMVFSDGVTPRYYERPEDYPKKHQFALMFSDGSALICSVRMYGFIDVCPAGTCSEEYYVYSSSRPNPMTEGFTYSYFRSLYSGGKKLTAKGFLATEQRIPGIGNGVLQDILWNAGISPRFKMENASEEDFRALYDSVVKTVAEMCEGGGRDTESDIFGSPGGYATKLSRNTAGQPCPKCGSPVIREAYMGGNVYYCEKCQKR